MQRDKLISINIIIMIFLSLVIIILLASQNQHLSNQIHYEDSQKIEDKAYTFKGKDIGGKDIDIRGKRSVLIFFNTTCEPCASSMHHYNKFYNKYKNKEIKIIGISSDNEQRTKNFVDQYKLAFPIILDLKLKIAREFGASYVPLLVLIDKNGKILFFQEYKQPPVDAISKIENIILSKY